MDHLITMMTNFEVIAQRMREGVKRNYASNHVGDERATWRA